MSPAPKANLSDIDFIDVSCAICGAELLIVVHLEELPDYVRCRNCNSAFVVEEGGERVLYGQIPEEYPQTRGFALRQWAWPEAIARWAVKERPTEAESIERQAEGPLEAGPSAEDDGAAPPADDVASGGEAAHVDMAPTTEPDGKATLAADGESPSQEAEEPDASAEGPPNVEVDIEGLFEDVLAEAEAARESLAASREPAAAPEDVEVDDPQPQRVRPFAQEYEDQLLEDTEEEEEAEPVQPEESPERAVDEPEVEAAADSEAKPGQSIDDLVAEVSARAEANSTARAPAPEQTVEAPPEEIEDSAAEVDEAEPILETEGFEPAAGTRYRVLIEGALVVFPDELCAHTAAPEVKGRLAIPGSVPTEDENGGRTWTTFQVPLSGASLRRAAARSEEEGQARLTAHLLAGLVALVLVVSAVVSGLVNFQESLIADLAIVAILGVIGYALSVLVLLNRAGQLPSPPDAAYVQSTLLVLNDAGEGRTAFEFRNRIYAERFVEANRGRIIGGISQVGDRFRLSTSPADEEPDE